MTIKEETENGGEPYEQIDYNRKWALHPLALRYGGHDLAERSSSNGECDSR